MRKLILASQSPRRKQILSMLGLPFEVDVADIDETIDESKELSQEIMRLSYEKAYAIWEKNKDAIVIGGDTIVVLNNKILGKPHSTLEAFNMLKMLSGNTHHVISSLSIISKEETIKDVSISDVHFIELTDEDIHKYIATGEPMDKAGAYAIQGYGSKFIDHIDGDYYAIMGLSIYQLNKHLRKLIEY